jgi:hypothetical protein
MAQFDSFRIVIEGTVNQTTGTANAVYNQYTSLVSTLQGQTGCTVNEARYNSTVYPKNGETVTAPAGLGPN